MNGVDFVDRHSRQERHADARIVVVGAGCLESTRLLLNSGIANSSGVLGHYLFDQFYVKGTVQAVVPEARDGKGGADLMGGSGYIPRFRNIDMKAQDFIRGYSVDFGSGGEVSPAQSTSRYMAKRCRRRWRRIAALVSMPRRWGPCCHGSRTL